MKIGQLKRFFGVLSIPESESRDILPVVTHDEYTSLNLPKEFDALKQWPKCTTIDKIRGMTQIIPLLLASFN